MRRLKVIASRVHARPRRGHLRLLKRDHPRTIDRYIDYFGGATRAAWISDPCGEALLDCLAPDVETNARAQAVAGTR